MSFSSINSFWRLNARKLASEVREHHNIYRWPIPIGLIAKNEGAVVKYTALGVDGSLVHEIKESYVVNVNSTIHPYRQRFTLAHELGHILLLKHIKQKPASTYYYRCLTRTFINQKREEEFCNAFASYLLIPDETIIEFHEWNAISIHKLVRKAHELKVSLTPLVWRVLEQAPCEGGFLWFRMMPKPTDPTDVKLRLDWGIFPKSERMYLPRYDSVPKNSSIHRAFRSSKEKLCKGVKLDFGSLRGKRNIIVKALGQAVLTIVLPKETKIL